MAFIIVEYKLLHSNIATSTTVATVPIGKNMGGGKFHFLMFAFQFRGKEKHESEKLHFLPVKLASFGFRLNLLDRTDFGNSPAIRDFTGFIGALFIPYVRYCAT